MYSPYEKTKITDFYRDLWTPTLTLAPKSTDMKITLDAKYDRRPDKLSYDLYGTEELWWVFSQRNKDILFDPINDFKAGITIFVPKEV